MPGESPSATVTGCAPRPQEKEQAERGVEVLTGQMLKGDEQAWIQFHQQYSGRLFRYLLVMLHGNEQGASEMLQITMARVARYLHRFTQEEVLWCWLTRLARNAAIDEYRKNAAHRERLAHYHDHQATHPPIPPDESGQILRSALEACLESLPLEDRSLIERKYFDREPLLQIALSLGITEKAAESRLLRARRALKNLLLNRLHEES